MGTAILALLGAAILALLCDEVKRRVRGALERRPMLVLALPAALAALFCLAAAAAGAASLPLAGVVLAYTLAPTLCALWAGPGPPRTPSALDFLVIAMLWLPVEAAAGAGLVPGPARGFLHAVLYGIAILLGLVLFDGFRGFPGLAYNLPRGGRDFRNPLLGFLATAPVLAVLGIRLGFIPWPHAPMRPDAAWIACRFGLIFLATALPEEILFRSLIQNLLMQRFGAGNRVLLAAAVIFGCAHLDNGPQALPNWRYAILATIAGYAYGKVFQKSRTVLASALFHAMVDAVKHFFF